MRTLVIAAAVVMLSGVVWGCGEGCVEFNGVCACDEKPEVSKSVEPTQNYASDEKPSRHPEPAWQRGEVNAETPPSLTAKIQAEIDEEKKADAEGKIAAKIPGWADKAH